MSEEESLFDYSQVTPRERVVFGHRRQLLEDVLELRKVYLVRAKHVRPATRLVRVPLLPALADRRHFDNVARHLVPVDRIVARVAVGLEFGDDTAEWPPVRSGLQLEDVDSDVAVLQEPVSRPFQHVEIVALGVRDENVDLGDVRGEEAVEGDDGRLEAAIAAGVDGGEL